MPQTGEEDLDDGLEKRKGRTGKAPKPKVRRYHIHAYTHTLTYSCIHTHIYTHAHTLWRIPSTHLLVYPIVLFSNPLYPLSTHLSHQAKPIVTDPSVLHPTLNGDNQEATHINLFMWIRVMLQQLQAEQIHRGAATKLMFESGEQMRLSLHTHCHTHLFIRSLETLHIFAPALSAQPLTHFLTHHSHPPSHPPPFLSAAAGALAHQLAIPPRSHPISPSPTHRQHIPLTRT